MQKSNYLLAGVFSLLLPLQALAHGEDLELQWQLEGFKGPESVVYDPMADVLFVSNVNGEPDEKNAAGFISTVSVDGELQELEWLTGLNAPKGLAVHGDKLYVADIDTLVEIDIPTATVTNRFVVDDAKFLNDVAAADNGHIFVSDMAMNRIHVYADGEFVIWIEDPALENPNGVYVQDNRLVVGAWGVMTDGFATETPGHLKAVSIPDGEITSIGSGEPIGNLDGVEADLDGDFYVTDWMAGKLFHIDRDGHVEVLLELNQGMADLGYIQERDLLLIPMMLDDKLLAYHAHASAAIHTD